MADRGLTADLIPSAYKAEELAEALAGQIAQGDKILIARAKVAREVLPESLRKIGAQVDVVTAYETAADCENRDELLAALRNGSASVVTFTSSSTVTNLLKVLGENKELLQKAALAAIGPVTAATLRQHGLTPAIEAEKYTIDGLMQAIENFYNK
nr:uroporphyrinogen-III synthase [uncultured Phascolarctobacterium sp.]